MLLCCHCRTIDFRYRDFFPESLAQGGRLAVLGISNHLDLIQHVGLSAPPLDALGNVAHCRGGRLGWRASSQCGSDGGGFAGRCVHRPAL